MNNPHGQSQTSPERHFGDPHEGDHKNPREAVRYRFSPEEMRAMKECNRESFFHRCLPLTVAGMVGLTVAKNAGIVRGAMGWKYASAIFIGYFGGKLSYIGVCKEKLMQIPNSRIAEAIRQQQGGTGQIFQEMSTMPDVPVSLPSLHQRQDEFVPGSIQYPGGTEQVGIDADEPSVTPGKPSTTYDELRRQNREEFLRQQQRPYVAPPQNRSPVGPTPSGSDHFAPPTPITTGTGRGRFAPPPTQPTGDTKYGDTGFN